MRTLLRSAAVAAGVAAAIAAVPAQAQAQQRCTAPKRIVSLSPTATEMLFAVNAGRYVVAVDDQSNFPRRAPRTRLSGFRANTEAVLRYRPDLVVVQNDSNNVIAGLRAARVRVVVQPAAPKLTESYRQIRQLGNITCNRPRADRVVVAIQRGISRAVRSVPRNRRGGTYFHELDPTLYTATSRTFIGQIYSRFGLRNIADGADSTGSGYPQMSNEAVIAANPSRIFLADQQCCGVTARSLAARPGWRSISAVRNGRVVGLNADAASRWGPRTPLFARQIAQALRAR